MKSQSLIEHMTARERSCALTREYAGRRGNPPRQSSQLPVVLVSFPPLSIVFLVACQPCAGHSALLFLLSAPHSLDAFFSLTYRLAHLSNSCEHSSLSTYLACDYKLQEYITLSVYNRHIDTIHLGVMKSEHRWRKNEQSVHHVHLTQHNPSAHRKQLNLENNWNSLYF